MKSSESILLTSVYLPAKGSKHHLTEYQEAIDQLYALHQKYNKTHTIIIGGDIDKDLNEPTSTKRNLYLRDFINECCLKYSAHICTHIDSLQINVNMEETAIAQAILKLCELLKETATLTSSAKTTFNAKPKLKVWTPEIRLSIKTARNKYKVWKDHGKPNAKSNIMLRGKKQAKKEFRRTV